MAIFFKIEYDNEFISVVKTFFSNKIDDFEFGKKAKKVPVSEFLNKLPNDVSEYIEKKINRLKKIDSMKLGILGVAANNIGFSNTSQIYYYVGDDVFVEYVDSPDSISKKEEALKYGAKFFGKSFMDRNSILIDSCSMHYYCNNKEIDKDMYFKLKKEYNDLHGLMNIDEIKKIVSNKKNKR